MDEEYDGPLEGTRGDIAKQITKTARTQHLTGKRNDNFIDTTSLCSSCKWSQTRRRAGQNTRQMECSVFRGPCPEDINECTEYEPITSLSLSQMTEIAHIIDVGPRRRVGFHGDRR